MSLEHCYLTIAWTNCDKCGAHVTLEALKTVPQTPPIPPSTR